MQTADRVAWAAVKLAGGERRWVGTGIGALHLLDIPGRGDGPPLVLLHGLSSSGADLTPLAMRLRDATSRIYCVDLPGHGSSAPLPSDMSAMNLGDLLGNALLDALNITPVLYGNSLGGLAATRFALAHPDRVAGLVLDSPGGSPAGAEDIDQFTEQFRMASWKDASNFIDHLLVKPGWKKPFLLWGVRSRFLRPSTQQVVARIQPDDLFDGAELEQLKMPIAFTWGEHDHILPREQLAWWREHLPPQATISTPEVGHSPYLDDLKGTAERVAAFLDQVRNPGAAAPSEPS